MKVDCSMCFTYKYISYSKVREEGCCKYCREHNWSYYKPDLLDVKQFLGFAERDILIGRLMNDNN